MGKLTEDQKAQAVALYDRGQSIGDVAAGLGVSRQSMWDVLRRRTTMRPRHRYGKENHFYRGSKDDDLAQGAIEKAILRGKIKRPEICEKCGRSSKFRDGRSGIQAHHGDYNKPLDVLWLCQPCHHEWHKHNKAIPQALPAFQKIVDMAKSLREEGKDG